MTSWLNHPQFRPVRTRLETALRSLPQQLQHSVPPIVFLCGGQSSSRRHHIRNYVKKYRSEALVFLADDVWVEISRNPELNALKIEEELGDLSDMIIIVVESAGSLAELGAFSLSSKLRKKLLPILDSEKKFDQSFINTGPVKWIEKDSRFSPPIYANYSQILLSGDEIIDRLDRFDRTKVSLFHMQQRSALFLLCDIVYMVGPAPLAVIEHFFYVPNQHRGIDLELFKRLVGLAKAMKLVTSFEHGGTEHYSWCGDSMPPQHFNHSGYMNLALERTRIVGTLLKMPSFFEIMHYRDRDDAA